MLIFSISMEFFNLDSNHLVDKGLIYSAHDTGDTKSAILSICFPFNDRM